MALNINKEVFNTYSVAGSNFQKGFKAGNFFLPNNLNPGVSVAQVHYYQIANPNPNGVISTLTGDGVVEQYFALLGVSEDIGEIVQYDSQNLGVKFDYPREIIVECDAQFEVTFNLIDRYMNKSVAVVTGELGANGNYFASTPVCPLYLNSVLFESAVGTTSFTANLSTGDTFELPYTDYGDQSFLKTVTGSVTPPTTQASGKPWMRTSLTNLSAPYVLEWDIEYEPAKWPAQTSTTSSGVSRPLIRFTNLGESIPYGTGQNYTFTVGQTVFPTFTQKLSHLITQQQASSGESTMGIKPISTNWIGWQG